MSHKTGLAQREGFADIRTVFAPEMALVLHSNRTAYSLESYVTVHTIEKGKILAGHPLTRGGLLRLCSLAMPGLDPRPVFLPENVLCYCDEGTGRKLMVWWRPPAQQYLMFTAGLGVKNGRAPLPGLVFCLRGHALHVWAVRGATRPVPQTELCTLPLPNISDGSVCMGNVHRDAKPQPDHIELWERSFFQSAFSPHHIVRKVGNKSFADFWNGLIQGKAKAFPEKVLATETTLKALLEGSNDH